MKLNRYTVLVQIARLFGAWAFAFFARLIALGYFLFSSRAATSRAFYRALFPKRNALYHRWCVFRQFQNFTTIHVDRLLVNQGKAPVFTCQGDTGVWQTISQSGAMLLMSHLGNWEMAARLLVGQRNNLRLLLYMGTKEKEAAEQAQKEALRGLGIRIIGVDQGDSAPFSAIEGVRFLQEGGLTSMTGDMLWRAEQKAVTVRFLGQYARIPEAPFVLAMVAQVPIFVFFAFRTGVNAYQFSFSEPLHLKAASRRERQQVIADTAQNYADLLEKALRRHPFEWYHFTPFLQKKEQ